MAEASERPPDRPRAPARWRVLAAVGGGGAVGALLRVELDRLFVNGPADFPVTTLCINLAGAFLLGALVAAVVERRVAHPLVRPLLGTGLLGAFTTFSTFVVEADLLVRAHRLGLAAGYVAVSLVAGMAAVALGTVAVRRPARLNGLSGPSRGAGGRAGAQERER